MDELKDMSIHHTAQKISTDIKNMKVYDNLYKTVQVTIPTKIPLKNLHNKKILEASMFTRS